LEPDSYAKQSKETIQSDLEFFLYSLSLAFLPEFLFLFLFLFLQFKILRIKEALRVGGRAGLLRPKDTAVA
jgi:hypothetical protein